MRHFVLIPESQPEIDDDKGTCLVRFWKLNTFCRASCHNQVNGKRFQKYNKCTSGNAVSLYCKSSSPLVTIYWYIEHPAIVI